MNPHSDLSSWPLLSLLPSKAQGRGQRSPSLTRAPKPGHRRPLGSCNQKCSREEVQVGWVGEWEQSVRNRDLLHPLHSHKSLLRSCLVRCQPADHSPPGLQARLSVCGCLHPLLEYPESPLFRGFPGRKHTTKGPIRYQRNPDIQVLHSKAHPGQLLEPRPLSSQVPKTANNPTPRSSYFIETRYFLKIKALGILSRQ